MGRFESKFIKSARPKVDELKIALDNRAFEIQMFWQRSNYFLVLMSALGIGTFSVKNFYFAPLISMFATVCSYYWFRTNLGSKFWQQSWEAEVVLLSREAGVRSFVKATPEVVEQVRQSFGEEQGYRQTSLFRKYIDRETVKKPSVTYHMIKLSAVATVVWAFVTVVLAYKPACRIINAWDAFPLACLYP